MAGDIRYLGVDDTTIDLFEGIYPVRNGMSYNSYMIYDEKIAVFDTVDAGFTVPWLRNIQEALGKRKPEYLIIQHMEPDHSANIKNFMEKYPDTILVASKKAFAMMKNFFGEHLAQKFLVIADGDMLSLGRHKLLFISALMVHWPEVMVTYDCTDKILFSADAFGKFGSLNTQEEWLLEARRYYFGIVGKYGIPVQKLLEKTAGLEIEKICPLHGSVLESNIRYYIDKYRIWSSYQPEEEGVLIAYTSVYGNTKRAVMLLQEEIEKRGKKVVVRDLARSDLSQVLAEAFQYRNLVLAATTYNVGLFPFMREFIHWLTERNFSNRTVAFVENGSWMPVAAQLMKQLLEPCKGVTYAKTSVTILSSVSEENQRQLRALAEELCQKDKVED